jgi:hypothetical protein
MCRDLLLRKALRSGLHFQGTRDAGREVWYAVVPDLLGL